MKRCQVLGATLLLCGLVAAVAFAADPPAANEAKKPAKGAKAAPAKVESAKAEAAAGPRYPRQFNKIASLSDEQKKKLQAVALQVATEREEFEARAKKQFLGVLTEEQRTELIAIEQGGAGKKGARKADAAKAQTEAPAKTKPEAPAKATKEAPAKK